MAFSGNALYIWAPHWLPRWLAGFGTHRKPITTPVCQASRSPSGGLHTRPLHTTHFNKQRREKPETPRVTDLMFIQTKGQGLVHTGKHRCRDRCGDVCENRSFCFRSADVCEGQTCRYDDWATIYFTWAVIKSHSKCSTVQPFKNNYHNKFQCRFCTLLVTRGFLLRNNTHKRCTRTLTKHNQQPNNITY